MSDSRIERSIENPYSKFQKFERSAFWGGCQMVGNEWVNIFDAEVHLGDPLLNQLSRGESWVFTDSNSEFPSLLYLSCFWDQHPRREVTRFGVEDDRNTKPNKNILFDRIGNSSIDERFWTMNDERWTMNDWSREGIFLGHSASSDLFFIPDKEFPSPSSSNRWSTHLMNLFWYSFPHNSIEGFGPDSDPSV
jgi:hypothetical protein